MKKKKITPEDLELNIEVTGGEQMSFRMTETKNCTPTNATCTDTKKCDTTTTNPTVPDCKTVEEAGCKQTDACWTIEPACETNVGCANSDSNAILCCPATKWNTCKVTVDNCVTNDTCGTNTINICLETQNNCADIKTLDDNCNVTILSNDGNCIASYAYTKCDC